MILKTDALFVVCSYGDKWSNPALFSDDVYTTKAEADGVAEDMNRRWKAMNHTVNGYGVKTLDQWFDQCKENGETDEARRNCE